MPGDNVSKFPDDDPSSEEDFGPRGGAVIGVGDLGNNGEDDEVEVVDDQDQDAEGEDDPGDEDMEDEEGGEEEDHIASEDDGESEIEETSTRSGTRRKHSMPK